MPGTPDRTLAELLRGNLDLATATLRIALISDATAYTFDSAAHEFVGDVLDGGTTAEEFSGSSGYTGSSDRQTLANQAVTEDNTDSEGVLDADNVVWNNVDGSNDIQGWLIYVQVGGDDTTPGDDPLLYVVDDDMSDAPQDLPKPVNGSGITVSWEVEGIINQVVQ